jgi:protein O-mannosyl-transferase
MPGPRRRKDRAAKRHASSEGPRRDAAPAATPAPPPARGPFWTTFAFQALAVAALAVALYANTLGHGYAFDDGIVIRENAYVQQGLAGIGNILTRDAFDSYFKAMRVDANQLPGGRYRPLSIVTFAVEQQLFGDSAPLRHAVNVLLYAATAVLLLWLLRAHLLRDPAWALLATVLFVVHPVHTEVVANIKGRDEILSFLFIVLTLAFALRYDEKRRLSDLLPGLCAYFLALLSKEYGLTLLALLPVAFFACRRRSPLEAIVRTLPFAAVAAAYVAARVAAIGFHAGTVPTDVLTNPFLYATADQALATKLVVLLRYLRLLFFPYPLSSDYSFRQIPYVGFDDPLPWLSLAVHAALLAWGVALLRRRDVRAFAVFLYAATLGMVSNLVLDIGAFMGERLLYHASLGFVLVATWVPLSLARRVGGESATPALRYTAHGSLTVLAAAIVVAAGAVTIERNRDWKDDDTLFTRDVVTAPDSALLNANASLPYLRAAELPENAARRQALMDTGMKYLQRAIEIHPRYAAAHINLGLALYSLGRLDEAEREWVLAGKLRAGDPMVERHLRTLAGAYFNKGLDAGSAGDYRAALEWFDKALRHDPNNPRIWVNVGKVHILMRENDRARTALHRALSLSPGDRGAIAALAAIGEKAP